MVTTEHHIEVLAMNIWRGHFGEKVLRSDWADWAAANPDDATTLRDQAASMIGAAQSHVGRPSSPKTTHNHSLAWLLT